MKKRNKLGLGAICLAAVALFASGCTANFATDKEKSRIAYALEPGISTFYVEGSEEANALIEEGYVAKNTLGSVLQFVEVNKNEDGTTASYKNSSNLNAIIESAKTSKVLVPTEEYFVEFDKIAFNKALDAYKAETNSNEINSESLKTITDDYGYVKFFADSIYDNYREINEEIRSNSATASIAASIDFENFYVSSLSGIVDGYHSTITVYNEVKYGNYNGKSIILNGVTWKEAWGKGGHLIEGLIVYPVAWLIDTFALIFAGGKSASAAAIQKAYANGVPQILSILIVTVIVRLFIFLVTFRSTLAQKKMNDLQPELAKIQQKYPNANTNQSQKQRLVEEQMRLYKKHKVNPLSQLLVLIIQFPVFIGVWGAMTGSAVLSTGKFLDLHLSDSIWDTLRLGPKGHAGWWTALVLILIMSAAQFFSMKVPQWIQKAKTKKVARLGANPAQKQQNRTANLVSYVMLFMIIIMGFTLPAAMGVYWFVGAIVSLIQTVFTSLVFTGKKKK